ncbi:hypothetical protein EDC56_0471 [Sinobacterium caligoides]|uniref:Nitroreductase domain-containing protein n=1 Tax=Sinobacterium caligoides TaxID=933926 RepID=A0A3N2DYT0_9GAMM|nr:nitroreductase [Sinobacterium caligoides]ROS04954.1 hypothetical protein EDC56_0471 [Sinobacterium caligoides]
MTVITAAAVSSSVEEVIRCRRSVRHFQPQCIDQALIEKLFKLAQWSPSAGNMQPWRSYVVSGERCQEVRSKLLQAVRDTQQYPPEKLRQQRLSSIYAERRQQLLARLYAAFGFKGSNKYCRHQLAEENFQLYGAPHCVFIFVEPGFDDLVGLDIGIYAQSLMLAMEANGIGCVVQAELCAYSKLIANQLGTDDSQRLMLAISFGYEQQGSAINESSRKRAPLFETTTFYS